jgi:putative transposase
MLVSILPKYSVAQVVGLIKGKGGIQIARTYLGGYFVSTVGAGEEGVRDYIRKKEKKDTRLDPFRLFDDE